MPVMQLGTQFVSGQCATTAIEFFGKVLKIDSEHTEAKLAFAEANIKRDEFKKISIKGEKAPVSVYEVLGINDPPCWIKKNTRHGSPRSKKAPSGKCPHFKENGL